MGYRKREDELRKIVIRAGSQSYHHPYSSEYLILRGSNLNKDSEERKSIDGNIFDGHSDNGETRRASPEKGYRDASSALIEEGC